MESLHEKRIIGGIVSGAVVPSGVAIDPADFDSSELGALFAAARKLEDERVPIDSAVLASRAAGLDIGFYSATDLELMAVTATSAAVVFEAVAKVKAAALKTYLLSKAATLALRTDASAAQILGELKDMVARAERDYRSTENDFVWLGDLKDTVSAVYRDLYEGVSYSVPTYFPKVDKNILDGFSKGDLHIVCGFTGQGKSALALNFARNQARHGHRVGIVSREMSAVENVIRLQATDSDVPRWQIKRGMYEATYEDLGRGLENLAGLPIALNTRTDGVEELRPQIGRMVEEQGLEVLYVDYLQLMHSKRNGTRAEEVASVSRTLKLIAMENKIPVVALCQFNRGAMQATKFDLLGYLKESSGIEQDASTILYVQFDKADDMAMVKHGNITILKNRNGASFTDIPVTYRGEVFRFDEFDYGQAQ